MFNHLLQTLALVAMLLTASFIWPTYVQAVTANELQKQADNLREEGKSLQAIDLYNRAIVHYQQYKDYPNMVDALTGRLLSWKHLFYKTEDRVYAIFVKKEAETILEIAKEYQLDDKFYLIHFLNATSALLLRDYDCAEREFNQAIVLYPLDNAEKGDWIAHLGRAKYKNGKKEEGKTLILEGVQKIKEKANQTDSFLVNVWISGAYLRLAKLLRADNIDESNLFLSYAKQIINSDKRLVIRKQQLESFMQESQSLSYHNH